LAAYIRKAPQDIVLPVKPVIEEGTLRFEHNPEWDQDPVRRALEDPAGEDLLMHAGAAERRWLSQEAQTEARQILRDIADAEQAASEAEHAMRMAVDSVNEAKAKLQAGIADGSIVPAESMRQRLARCPVHVPEVKGLLVASVLASAIVGIIEGIQLGVTFADTMGVDVSALGAQMKRAPFNVVVAFLLGFGAAFAILAAAHIGLAKLHEALYGEIPVRRRVVDALVGTAFLAFVTVVLYYVSTGRHGAAAGASALRAAEGGIKAIGEGLSPMAFFWIAFCLTIGAAMLTHVTALRLRARREAQALRREWLAEVYQEKESRERAEELVNNLERERIDLERKREEARDQLRQLNQKAQTVEKQLREDFDRRARFAKAFANALEGALQRDLHYFNLFSKKDRASQATGRAVPDAQAVRPSRPQPSPWERELPRTLHSTIEEEVRS
jgi:hypothetical protein